MTNRIDPTDDDFYGPEAYSDDYDNYDDYDSCIDEDDDYVEDEYEDEFDHGQW